MANNQNNNQALAKELLDVIKQVIGDIISKQDSTCFVEIDSVNVDNTLNVYIWPDRNTLYINVPNNTLYSFSKGDIGILYKINNQINNSFIISKIRNNDTINDFRVVTGINGKTGSIGIDKQIAEQIVSTGGGVVNLTNTDDTLEITQSKTSTNINTKVVRQVTELPKLSEAKPNIIYILKNDDGTRGYIYNPDVAGYNVIDNFDNNINKIKIIDGNLNENV